jgi:predicted branched-subunit amino acid permease
MTPVADCFIVVVMSTAAVPNEIGVTAGSPPDRSVRRPGRSERSAAADGVRAMLPWLVGVVPLGVSIGVATAESGVGPATGLLAGLVIFAGSAHLAMLDGIAHGAAGAAILTALVINLRLLAYGAAMRPFWGALDRGRRLVFAALLIDPTFANGLDGYDRHDVCDGHRHYLAGGLVLMGAWLASIAIGIAAGSLLPDVPVLGLLMPLFLLAEVGGHLDHRSPTVAAIVGAMVGGLAIGLPLQAGIIAGIAAGAAAGAFVVHREAP